MFTKIRIKNFRSCYDTNLELGRSICALSGRNGVGKSNILKAIDWTSKTAISANAVNVSPAGNYSDRVEDHHIDMTMSIDDITYNYTLNIPNRTTRIIAAHPEADRHLTETLSILKDDGSHLEDIFVKQADEIRLTNRPDPIRIPKTTPSIAALMSLLPEHERVLPHIHRVAQFFAGVRYYSLDDRPDAKDTVSEQQYNEWLFKYQNEAQLTDSVALRLLYMWLEDKELLSEFKSIMGRNGLGLIDDFSVFPFERKFNASDPKVKQDGVPTKVYYHFFDPPNHMGGAGDSYMFQDLSVGTRRVIRLVTSLLFDKRSLMLLEQPEDSVHPGLLRKLIDLLRSYSYNTQMIFTTHSPEVLDIMEPEEVLLITATAGRTEARKLPEGAVASAKKFLKNDGTLSDFLESYTSDQ